MGNLGTRLNGILFWYFGKQGLWRIFLCQIMFSKQENDRMYENGIFQFLQEIVHFDRKHYRQSSHHFVMIMWLHTRFPVIFSWEPGIHGQLKFQSLNPRKL